MLVRSARLIVDQRRRGEMVDTGVLTSSYVFSRKPSVTMLQVDPDEACFEFNETYRFLHTSTCIITSVRQLRHDSKEFLRITRSI